MQTRNFLERCAGALALVSIAFVVAGTKACQEDYDLGSQTEGADQTATAEPTEDDDIVRGTPTADNEEPEATPTVAPATPTPEPAPAFGEGVEGVPGANPGVSAGDGGDDGLLQELSTLSEKSPDEAAAAARAAGGGNWLGQAFDGESNGEAERDSATPPKSGVWQDSDGDGFADWIEINEGSEAYDGMFVPSGMVTTNLDSRVRGADADLDGLSTADEFRLGTDPHNLDSDQDGRPDGAEVISGGNPLEARDRYKDQDGDGLSDELEASKGTRMDLLDSDDDGLRDDIELAIGSDPLKVDTDDDGVSDGKEFDLGADPTIPEAGAR